VAHDERHVCAGSNSEEPCDHQEGE
jgi:hypothetical protein